MENGIPELEKIKINFMKISAMFDPCGCRQAVTGKNLLEKWWGYVGTNTGAREGKKEVEEETYFNSSEILSWEKKQRKTNGKYIEA